VLLVLLSFSFGHCVTEGQATQWPNEKEQKNKQHKGQKKGDRRTSNIMTKRKGQKKNIVLLVRLSFSFDHCVACPSVPFLLVIVLLVLLSFSFCHCVACPSDQKKRTEGQATQ
jgi:hypothetical protein